VIIQFPAIDGKGEPLPKEQQGEYLRPEMGAIVTFLNRKAAVPDAAKAVEVGKAGPGLHQLEMMADRPWKCAIEVE
jgi:hypothetical protein